MSTMTKVIGCLLFCNVAAILLMLIEHEAQPTKYLNLLGCVMFGAWLKPGDLFKK